MEDSGISRGLRASTDDTREVEEVAAAAADGVVKKKKNKNEGARIARN